MGNAQNSVIKFDLHIHSVSSKYKENPGLVDQSTKDNLGILLSKLDQHNVALFSITDHNRFDPDIYLEINKILALPDHPYQNVKAVLAGVEFDVILDEGMSKCHIIAIFDANNEVDKLKRINESIQSHLIEDVQGAYTKNDFEAVLKEIGLNTILIASQRKDINNQSGNHNSLSDSAINVEQIIRVGYINALEFQKPKVEGILLNNLKRLTLPISLFSGSDCHDWSCYPFHDSQNQNKEFHHSKAKILPTFKGLLMAVTSPETRFNCSENTNTNVIESIKISGNEIPLVNGINAIIGENGSGKTTLLKLLNGKTTEAHVKKLVQDNKLEASSSIDPQKIKYIEQGQIIKKFNDKTLFTAGEKSNFKELDSTFFRDLYCAYSESLKKCIEAKIAKQEQLDSLSKQAITFEEGMTVKNYFVDVTHNEGLEGTKNPHEIPYIEISGLVDKANLLLGEEYYEPYKDQLERAILELTSIRDAIGLKSSKVNYEANIKNIMHSCIDDYLLKIKINSSTKDREIKEYNNKKERIVDSVTTAIKMSLDAVTWPDPPHVIEGVTKNPKQGFFFNREAAYNGVSMIEHYYLKMFNKEYNCIDKLQSIDSYKKFTDAVRTCTSASDINAKWTENFDKFISDAVKTSDYIMEGTDQKIGNTLGEMSLSYYKFFTQGDREWKVLIVDQPEDNISNNNISRKLISYFNSIRDERQIIFVTHNPLLVVNLDADNIIFVNNDNGELRAQNGCLEYEDEHTNILELIAENMDGGKETIEKRLKVYGKNN